MLFVHGVKVLNLIRCRWRRAKATAPSTGVSQRWGRGREWGWSQTCPLDVLLIDDNAVNITVGKRILALFVYKSSLRLLTVRPLEAAEKSRFDLILLDL